MRPRWRFVFAVVVLSFPISLAALEIQILLDVDRKASTGCAVAGMDGVDQVLVTTVAATSTSANVTSTARRVCSGGVLGAPIDADTSGWGAGFKADSGQMVVESRIACAALGSGPFSMRVGFTGAVGSTIHAILNKPNGDPILLAGSTKPNAFVLDGLAKDWSGIPPLASASAAGQQFFRLSQAYGYGDGQYFWFRVDVNLSLTTPPVATDDAYTIRQGQVLVIAAPGVLQNDDDPNDLSLIASIATLPAHGTLTLGTGGGFVYAHDGTSGTSDFFEYRASNGILESGPARVAITILPNARPNATKDAYSVAHRGTLSIAAPGVLVNDTDADGDPLTASGIAGTTNGALTLNADGSFTYVHNGSNTTADAFTYSAKDAFAQSTPAQVSIAIAPDLPPVAVADSYSVAEGETLTVAAPGLFANDSDADTPRSLWTATVVTAPAHGTVAIGAGGVFTYVNDGGAASSDSFVYRLSDGIAPSADATVSIAVTPSNDPPQVTDGAMTTDEDVPVRITLAGTDSDGDPMTFRILVGPRHGRLSGNAPDLVYTPHPDYNGNDAFVFQADDGTLHSEAGAITINIRPVDDAPVGNVDVYGVIPGQPITISPAQGVLANDVDADGDPMIAAILSGPAHGTITFNLDGSFEYRPDPDFTGIDSITYAVTDPAGASTSFFSDKRLAAHATFAVPATVVSYNVQDNPNHPPSANPRTVEIDEDSPQVSISLDAIDPDNDALAFSAGGGIRGIATFAGLVSASYLPKPNEYGTDTATYSVSDGFERVLQPITINIRPVNDAPIAVDDVFGVVRDTQLSIPADRGVGANDLDDDPGGTITVRQNVAHGTLQLSPDGSFTYTPESGFSGTDSFIYSRSDGELSSGPATARLNVHPFNTPPVVHQQVVAGMEDSAQTIALIGSDADADRLSFAIASPPDHGSVTLWGDLASYQPELNYVGPVTFTVTANDGFTTSAPAAVTIHVGNVNDAPTASSASFSVKENTDLSGTLTFSDPDGDLLTPSIQSNPAQGTLSLNANGAFKYVPPAGFSGSTSFSYVVSDGVASSSPATVSINVVNVNDQPRFTLLPMLVVAETQSDGDGTLLATFPVASNVDAGSDTRESSQRLFFQTTYTNAALFQLPPVVKLGPNGTGTLALLLVPHAFGTATITVTLVDNGGTQFGGVDRITQSLTLTVTPVNDPPSFRIDTFHFVFEDAPLVTIPNWATQISSGPFETDQTFFTVQPSDSSLLTDLAISNDGTLTYRPVPDKNGETAVRVTLHELPGPPPAPQTPLQTTASFRIAVVAVNDRPSFTRGPDITVLDTSGPNTFPNWASARSAGPSDEATQAISFVVQNNTAPLSFIAGPSIDAAGTLSFTPRVGAEGDADVTVLMMDNGGTESGGANTSAPVTFRIRTGTKPAITSAAMTAFQVGQPGTFTVTASGFPKPSIAISSGTLPAGVAFTDNGNGTGTLSGTPAPGTGGMRAIVFNATNAQGTSAQSFLLNVNFAPSFTSTSTSAYSTTFHAGEPATFTITTIGLPAPSIIRSGDALPAGVTFADNGNGTASLIATSPQGRGTYHFTFTADNGIAPLAVQSFTLFVDCPTLTITPTSLPAGIPGVAYGPVTFGATTSAQYTFALSGTLPQGITFNTTTASLQGTPVDSGVYPLTVTATNTNGCQTSATRTLTISPVVTNDIYQAIGNTQVAGGTDFAPATPHATFASVLANDRGTNLSVVPVSGAATTAGGTITITANGSFLYTPPYAMTSTLDSYTYMLQGTAVSGTITFTITGKVFYVKNDAPAGGTGASHAPYNTLAQAQGASDASQVLYVMTGDGTTAGQDAGITLKDNQKLIGAGVALVVDGVSLALAGARPKITNTAGSGIVVANGNTIRGLTVSGSSGNGIDGTATNGITVDAVVLENNAPADGSGLVLTNATGSVDVTATSITGNGFGMTILGGTAAVNIDAASTISGSTAAEVQVVSHSTGGVIIGATLTGRGIKLENNHNEVIVFTGTQTITTSTHYGVLVTGNTGATIFFSGTLDVDATNVNGFVAENGGTLNVVGAAAVAAGGSATYGLRLDGMVAGASGIHFARVSATSGVQVGVSMAGMTGRVVIDSGTLAASATGVSIVTSQSLNLTLGSVVIGPTATGIEANDFGNVTINGASVIATQSLMSFSEGLVNGTFASVSGTGLTLPAAFNWTRGSVNVRSGNVQSSGSVIEVAGRDVALVWSADTLQTGASSPFLLVTHAHSGSVVVNGNVTIVGGTGLRFDSAYGTYAFNGPLAMSGGDAGIDIILGSSGTFTFGSGVSISDPSGTAFDISDSNANVTYAGSITQDVGTVVSVSGEYGGTVQFTGPITDGDDGDGSGISLTTNNGATIRFAGGLVLNTAANPAFTATGGGKIEICDESPCNPNAAGSLVNKLTTTTATALKVVGTTIGPNHLELRSISSTGGTAAGIVLNITGTSGGLKVRGTGTAGSGGTISAKTGADIYTLTSGVPALGLNRIGSGVILSNTSKTEIGDMNLSDFTNPAIVAFQSSDLAFRNVTISGASGDNAALEEGAVYFANLSGPATITGSTINGGFRDNLHVVQSSGTLDRVTVTGTTFGFNNFTNGNASIRLNPVGNATLKFMMQSSTVKGSRGDWVSATTPPGTSLNVVLSGNTFDSLGANAHPTAITSSNRVSLNSTGRLTVDVNGNTVRGSKGAAILLTSAASGTAVGTIEGYVRNNDVGIASIANSGSTEASGVDLNGTGGSRMTVVISGNQVYQYNFSGINLTFGTETNNGSVFAATIFGNTVHSPGSNVGLDLNGILVSNGISSATDDFTTCVDIGGATAALKNNVTASGRGTLFPQNADIRLRHQFATTIQLPGYTAGVARDNTDNEVSQVSAYLAARNTLSTAAANSSSTGGGYINTSGGAPCAQPSFN